MRFLGDQIIIPYLQENYTIDDILNDDDTRNILRDALKSYAEQAKNALSFEKETIITSQLDEFGEDDDGEEIELDMTITVDDINKVMEPIFQKAIDICKNLLKRNNLTGSDITELVLVGGPTFSPLLRSMIRTQLTDKVNTDVNPMTAVAYGAALYASGLTYEGEAAAVSEDAVALDMDYEANTVDPLVFVAVKLAAGNKLPADHVMVELQRSDKGWSSGQVSITDMGDVIECQLMENKANTFNVVVTDDRGNRLKTDTDAITIIQGTKVGSAVLPYNIGIEVHDTLEDKDVFKTMKGLEKNQSLPASGLAENLMSPRIRAGQSRDKLIVPIYQGEYNVEHSSAMFNDHVFDVVVDGTELSSDVEENSPIDITINVDRSQLMNVEINFRDSGQQIKKEVVVKRRQAIELSELQDIFANAEITMQTLQQNSAIPQDKVAVCRKALDGLLVRFKGESASDDGRMHLLADIRRLQLDLEQLENTYKWNILEDELNSAVEAYKHMADKEDNPLLVISKDEYVRKLEEQERKARQAINSKDYRMYRDSMQKMESVKMSAFPLLSAYNLFNYLEENFDDIRWFDAHEARRLLNAGQVSVMIEHSVSKSFEIARKLIALQDMPENQKARI